MTPSLNRILVVEDDEDIRQLVVMNLRDQHYEVESTDQGDVGLQWALENPYDLLILDVMLPAVDGLEICRQLRSKGSTLPVLMVTARDAEIDRVVGLELGADDYLTKPFSVRELLARVKAMLRRVDMLKGADEARQAPEPSAQLNFRDLAIDIPKRQVQIKGQILELTSTEFDLLVYLARHPGTVFNRSQLLDGVWGYQHAGYEHTVNSHINRLRTKLEADPSHPEYILTVWGVGYKFNDQA